MAAQSLIQSDCPSRPSCPQICQEDFSPTAALFPWPQLKATPFSSYHDVSCTSPLPISTFDPIISANLPNMVVPPPPRLRPAFPRSERAIALLNDPIFTLEASVIRFENSPDTVAMPILSGPIGKHLLHSHTPITATSASETSTAEIPDGIHPIYDVASTFMKVEQAQMEDNQPTSRQLCKRRHIRVDANLLSEMTVREASLSPKPKRKITFHHAFIAAPIEPAVNLSISPLNPHLSLVVAELPTIAPADEPSSEISHDIVNPTQSNNEISYQSKDRHADEVASYHSFHTKLNLKWWMCSCSNISPVWSNAGSSSIRNISQTKSASNTSSCDSTK